MMKNQDSVADFSIMSTEKNCLDSLNALRASLNSSMDLQPISKVIREKKGIEKATQHLKNL